MQRNKQLEHDGTASHIPAAETGLKRRWKLEDVQQQVVGGRERVVTSVEFVARLPEAGRDLRRVRNKGFLG